MRLCSRDAGENEKKIEGHERSLSDDFPLDMFSRSRSFSYENF